MAEGYSKIATVEVTNFMVFKHAKVAFDDSNIINLKGYNSSGKSTIIKALFVCLANVYSQNQAKLIRHGEDYFRIIVTFDDGVSIVRDKYINGQSLYEMYKDGEKIFTTKEGNKLTKVDDVPAVIQDYLGLCVLSTGVLNYQSRQDPLWLIETKGSENYYSLNEILKAVEIARATTLINTDKNKVNSDISELESSLNRVELELSESKGYSEHLLTALEHRESVCRNLSEKYTSLGSIVSTVLSLEKLKPWPELETLDDGRVVSIESLQIGFKTLSELKPIPAVTRIETSRLSAIDSLAGECEELSDAFNRVLTPRVDLIDESQVRAQSDIAGILNILSALNEATGKEAALAAERTKVDEALETAVLDAQQKGIQFVKCDNCGSYMEVQNV